MKKRSSSKKRRGGAMEHQALTGSRQRKKTIPEAEAVAESARKLLGAADKTHREADELHQAIHQMHGAVEGMHAGGTRPSLAETRDLVTGQSIRPRPLPFPIVGIGASAGGYEAFTEFVEHLPQDSGMAFVLVQHLDPKHKSKLSELLAHSSRIPVEEVQSDAQVRPNRIYVIPENTTMTILGGRLRLAPRNDFATAAMPIDLFFRSLAQHQQSNAIAVVLSGTGSDGSLGVEAIKGEGGITFAQDEGSAKYFGMPGSAMASGSIDFVMKPADIARELVRIGKHPHLHWQVCKAEESKELDKLGQENVDELTGLFGLLRSRMKVDFSLYKQSTLKRRITRRMLLHKVETLKDYYRLLEKTPSEVNALFNDLLINVTSFFRDLETFQVLKRKLFPRILKAHADDSPLRFWVCGCATGEEAYSLAISLVEFFESAFAHRQVQIFATDISEGSIEKARAGIYPENIIQDVSPERLRRFFSKVNGNYQVHKSIRDMCIFARQNMLVDPPFSNLDLVTCRNVLIYLGALLQRKAIPLFHYALRPTGFLVLGTSESIGSSTEHFTLIDKKNKIYAKKLSYVRPGFEVEHSGSQFQTRAARTPVESVSQRESQPLDLPAHVDKLLLRDFGPAAVVVNSELEVIHFRGRTGDYLEHAPGTASLNLLKMVREDLVLGLRAALNKAVKKDLTVRQTGVELQKNGVKRQLTIEVVPFRMGGPDRCFLVVFKESGPSSAAPTGGDGQESRPARAVRERREITRLKRELATNKESLQSIIEEQEGTNEELKSANEEIQSSNEELQSTNEELETAKEELQSTNEELTTLNEELQNRNNELSQANNDLTNLLGSVNIAILILGNDLTIRRFTPMAEKLFNLIPADVGRPLSDMNRTIPVLELDKTVRDVIDNLTPIEREAQDREGHWYLLRIRPYRTRENKIDGVVILLVDIDELRRALDVVLATVKQPLMLLGADLKVLSANEGFRGLFNLTERLEGKSIFEIGEGRLNVPEYRTVLEAVASKNKNLNDFELEADFRSIGRRKMRLNARRFFEEGRGMELILLGFEDMTPAPQDQG